MGLFNKLKSKMQEFLEDEEHESLGGIQSLDSGREQLKALKESFFKEKKILQDSFNAQDKQIKNSLGVFGIKWETRAEKVERKKMEEARLEERRRKAREEAERRAEREAYIRDIKNNPENHREELLEWSYTQSLYPELTIRRIQENFNEDFPFLRIAVYMVMTGKDADRKGGTIISIDSEDSLSSVRSYKNGNYEIEISAKDTPDSLERKFRAISGLVIKIGYNDEEDERFYISKNNKEHKMNLCDLSIEFKRRGYNFADIS